MKTSPVSLTPSGAPPPHTPQPAPPPPPVKRFKRLHQLCSQTAAQAIGELKRIYDSASVANYLLRFDTATRKAVYKPPPNRRTVADPFWSITLGECAIADFSPATSYNNNNNNNNNNKPSRRRSASDKLARSQSPISTANRQQQQQQQQQQRRRQSPQHPAANSKSANENQLPSVVGEHSSSKSMMPSLDTNHECQASAAATAVVGANSGTDDNDSIVTQYFSPLNKSSASSLFSMSSPTGTYNYIQKKVTSSHCCPTIHVCFFFRLLMSRRSIE